MRTYPLLKSPGKIVGSTIQDCCSFFFFTASRIPLQSVGSWIFRNMEIGTGIFNCSMCNCISGRSRDLKNSVG